MADMIEEFFAGLGKRAQQLLPEKFNGSIRFDLTENGQVEHWYVTIERGDILVSHEERAADTVMTVDRRVFGQIITGEIGVVASVFSGQSLIEGSLLLIVTFKRFFASPPGTRDPRELAAWRRRA